MNGTINATDIYKNGAPYRPNADTANYAKDIDPAKVVKSLNSMHNAVTLAGQGGASITSSNDTIYINAGAGGGGSGIQSIGNSNNTLDIINPNGLSTTINVKNGGIGATQLTDNAVTSAKIADNSVTGTDIDSTSTIKLSTINFVSVPTINSGNSKLLFAPTIGNIYLGLGAGNVSSTLYNTGIGTNALHNISVTGDYNTAVGSNALTNNVLGKSNTAVGSDALVSNTVDSNVAVGAKALFSNTTGFHNTSVGTTALRSNTSGGRNTAIGAMALTSNIEGYYNTAVGYQSLMSNTYSYYNTAVGTYSLKNNTGEDNTAMGFSALSSNTTGADNTALGSYSLKDNTGSGNTAVGHNSLLENENGGSNTAVGFSAMIRNRNGISNTAIGRNALTNNTADSNAALGSYALQSNTTGTHNTASGSMALYSNVTGNYNTAIGFEAGRYATGEGNVFIGHKAGRDATGDYKLYINNTYDTPLIYGDFASNRVGINTTNPSDELSVAGDASKTTGSVWKVFSDRRLKKDINSFSDGLSVLKNIHPVTFRYNGKAGFSSDKEYVGIIAQEIQKIAPYMVGTFKTKLDPTDAVETELLNFDSNALFYITINAVKELDTKVAEIEILKARLAELEGTVKSLLAQKNEAGNNSLGEVK